MSRLTQITQNSFIRLQGWLDQFFNFLKKLFGWLNQFFSFFAKVLGFTNEVQSLEPTGDEAKIPAKASQDMPPTASTTRRRPDSKMADFLKMAQQTKTSK